MANEKHDVVICGGGLAGLTLALQLRAALPSADLLVVEKQLRPLPVACHKVGESCIELGAHYLDTVLGLRPYLLEEHLVKNGLRFFCGAPGSPIEERTEIGPGEPPVVPSYQLDRGAFEDHLRALCERRGITLLEGFTVEDVVLGAPHQVLIEQVGRRGPRAKQTRLATWVVDASGRRQLIQRKLGLRQPVSNRSSSSWFRVDERVTPKQLVPAEATRWHARDVDDDRWLSTSHLMGPGHWVWLIPLASGGTSIGIVTDGVHHDFESHSTETASRAWLADHEPALAERLTGVDFTDFLVMKSYSYGSERVLSADRWACVGEAGLFVDPLYSPGTDFIAMANTLAATLIEKDLTGGGLEAEHVDELHGLFDVWVEDASRMLGGNGKIFPHADIFGAKMWWDFFHYWTFICQYFFQGIFREPPESHARFRAVGQRYFELNERVQQICETWAELKTESLSPDRGFVPLPMFPSTLADAHLELQKPLTPDETLAHMKAELATIGDYITELLLLALRGVGLDNAERFAEAIGLASWVDEIDPERITVDSLPRRERLDQTTRVARDLERALGRSPRTGASAADLLSAALPNHSGTVLQGARTGLYSATSK